MIKIITQGIYFGICVLLLSACGGAPLRPLERNVRQSDLPPIGEIQTAELGAKMLVQQNVEVIKGRKLTQITRGIFSGLFPVDYAGMYVARNDGEYYCGTQTLRDPLNYGKVQLICFTDQEMREKNLPFVDTEEIVQKPTNLQRVMEYSGKSGSTLSIFYKEFTETTDGAFIRPAFTQEFKFDLGESNVIGIKGARIEVISATNTGLTYKVLSHFPR